MKSSCLIASGALLLVGLAPGCNEILGTTRGTPEGAGGSSTASSSASSGTGGAPFSTGTGGGTSAASSTSGDGGSASASSSSAGGGSSTSVSASASTSASTGSGPCTTDEDGDGVISWQCPGGNDCADQDKRAHPGADFTVGAAINGLRSPGTLPYDFDCDGTETKQTPVLSCAGAICPTPATTKGFQQNVSCGASGMLGHCAGMTPCAWVSDSVALIQICK